MEYYTRGEHERAVEAWKPINDKSSEFATAQNNIATSSILMKKFDQARAALDKAIERDPKNQLYQNNRVWLERASKEASK
jgi:tetratricopeptide (TPR) repeat protein